ncbi:class I SAM-dependent methyltransferase [Nocardioides donggukensis]|uniref:Methyltransferase domain-containing protein n=1 Tax=Nocardioides donggukensis TaxID=2774019 RepID=A0A927KAX1_9ACTN|nr:methyltransferase domain-containing protein [Nocardioides donggukensis]MBD8870850.1 methyltransferase domain-containing protein [Nocardioides donggukensis]
MASVSAGAVPSPNIWHHTATYELENHAADPERNIEAAMRRIADWTGRSLLDLGCGTGFHLPRWAEDAASVLGVEPHGDLVALARRRTRRLANVQVRQGAAQQIPAADASVDVLQVRWAYFFGPGCEPGLAEVERVVRRGGTAFVIDNDATRSTFGGWFRRGYPSVDPDAVERFWAGQGFTRTPVDIRWAFGSRSDFEAVVRIEFGPDVAEQVLAEHDGAEVDYAVNLWSRTY